MKEPFAEKIPHTLLIHGHERIDPYFWMNQRDSKKVLDLIEKENQYSEHYFNKYKSLEDKLLEEFEQRINPNEEEAPFKIYGRTFQYKYIEKLDYPILYEILSDKKKIEFFNENKRAENQSYYENGYLELSPNQKILAFSEDFVGRRKYTIRFREEKTGKYLNDIINNTDGSFVWAADSKTIFYLKKDTISLREYQVFKHILGTPCDSDILCYEEKDEKFSLSIYKTHSKKHILIHSESSTTTEILYLSSNNPSSEFQILLKREQGHLYQFEENDNTFFLLSNKLAENNKILTFSSLDQVQNGVELLAHNPERQIENITSNKDFLLCKYRQNALDGFLIYEYKIQQWHEVLFEEELYSIDEVEEFDYELPYFSFAYQSMTTPYKYLKYHVQEKQQSVYFENKLIDQSFSPNNYISKRIEILSYDGEKIPVSLVYSKNTNPKDAPLLLYGYGSYGVSLSPVFSATRLSLLDRGFIFAYAHVRGGKEKNETWYQNGKLLKKKNTFSDFISCAESLPLLGFGNKDKVYAMGGSAGGLLMGAICNLSPYLWKGVVAQVPFVDAVTTMLDKTIPLTTGEYEEWGNPENKEHYYYMLSYSPYDQVKKMNYPALYITTGYHDSQVQYWEPLKWVSKLRDCRTNRNPLLFECSMDAGHGGGSGRTNSRKEIAREFVFLLSLEGVKN